MEYLKEKPYIGVTGVSTPGEASAIAQTFVDEGLTNEQNNHVGMIGILADQGSLIPRAGERIKYPALDQIRQIFGVTQGKAFNTLHYHTYRESDLTQQLEQLLDRSHLYSDRLCDGVQLNLRWPPVDTVEKTKKTFPDLKIILQLGPSVLTEGPEDIVTKLTPYVDLIDYALIDPSGGRNRVFQINTVAPLHNQIRKAHPDLPLAFAGGFNTRNVRTRLWVLLQTVATSNFGIDAEGGLRVQSEQGLITPISINRARGYIRNAALFFRTIEKESPT